MPMEETRKSAEIRMSGDASAAAGVPAQELETAVVQASAQETKAVAKEASARETEAADMEASAQETEAAAMEASAQGAEPAAMRALVQEPPETETVPEKEPSHQTDNPHDKGYKSVLKNRRVLLHMLRKYTDFQWTQEIREEDIEFVDKEFITEQFRTYESDLICRIRHRGRDIYLFLLMELQSGMDFTMPFRLLVYMVNMWEQHFRNVPVNVREQKEFRLPVIVPMVLYNGKESWTALRRFRDYLQDGNSYGECGVTFEYALVDVKRLAEELILNSNSVIDNIFYLDNARERKDFLAAVGAMTDRIVKLPADEKNLMETWFTHVLEGKFSEKEWEFIRDCLRKGEKEMISGFEQIVIEEREEARQEGLAEGTEIGMKRGLEQGIAQGTKHGIQVLVRTCKKFGQTAETAVEVLVQNYDLSDREARELAERYWND